MARRKKRIVSDEKILRAYSAEISKSAEASGDVVLKRLAGQLNISRADINNVIKRMLPCVLTKKV